MPCQLLISKSAFPEPQICSFQINAFLETKADSSYFIWKIWLSSLQIDNLGQWKEVWNFRPWCHCGGGKDPHWYLVGSLLAALSPDLSALSHFPPQSLQRIFAVFSQWLNPSFNIMSLQLAWSFASFRDMWLAWMCYFGWQLLHSFLVHKSISKNSLTVPQRHLRFSSLSFPLISMAVSTLLTKVLLLKYTT